MSVIFVEHRENGELADAERVHLSDQDSTFGIKRLSDGQVVIAADTPVTRVDLGRYEFNIDLLSPLFDYVYVFQIQTRDEDNQALLEHVQGFIPSQADAPIGEIPESQPPDYTPTPPLDTGLQQEGGQFYKPDEPRGAYFDGTQDLPASGGERTNRSWQEAYGYGYGGPAVDDGFWDGISYEDLCVIPITPRGQCIKDRAAAMARAQLKDTDPTCWAFSEDEIDMYLESALSDFNATPMFTRFQWHDLEDRWLHILALGAQVFALFAQGLVEVGREFVITDNGISFQPPPISSHFQSTATTLLAHYQQNKELIKGNMKPTPSAVGVFTVLAINPMLTRLRHLRERRIV